MFKKILLVTLIALTGAFFLFGYNINEKNKVVQKTTINDDYEFIAINNVLMWISNNGDGSHDPVTDGNGFYWPGGRRATQSAIFEDGLLFGGVIDGEVRVGGSTYRHGLQAGKILPDGTADDPTLEKYRIYKIRKDFKTLQPSELISQEEIDRYQRDFDEWPVEDGAPWVDMDGDGVFTRGVDSVQFVGDEVLWYVSNDLDEGRTTFLYGTAPFGLEVQSTTFAFDKTGDLGDIVFKKFLVINKGTNTVQDMILAYWSDTDLGDANDDFTGCDTNLVLGYTYNGTNDDQVYGTPPPSVGYDFFQGPIVPATDADSAKFLGEWRRGFKNLGLTSFTLYINGNPDLQDPDLGLAEGSQQMYWYMTSQDYFGNPFIDPNTGQAVKYTVPGDPVRGIGWYEGDGWPGGYPPGDRRHLMSSGPFTMAPGDTQEIVVGIVIAIGKDRLNSISKLKRKDRAAQNAYDFDFIIPDSPPTPVTKAVAGDRKITLYWEDNAERYRSLNYSFEGYRIWQFPNELGSFDQAELLATYDIVNGVTEISDLVALDEYNSVEVNVPVVVGSDNGLVRKFDISTDQLSGTKLVNDRDYYFGVTAYGYAEGGIPPVLESSVDVNIVRPGTNRIDVTYELDNEDLVMPRRLAGGGDPDGLRLQVVDPEGLKDATYKLTFGNTNAGNLAYTFFNETSGDTIYDTDTVFYSEPTGKIVEGFTLLVSNPGQDSLDASGLSSAIKSAEQITRGDGVELTTPISVAGSASPNTDWRLLGLNAAPLGIVEGKSDVLNAMNWTGNAGQDVYEIRFTTEENGSEYYLTGYRPPSNPATAAFNDDPKATGKVPFQVWYLGPNPDDTSDDLRMIVKVFDKTAEDIHVTDSSWTQFGIESPYAGKWEAFYAYIPYDSIYPADGVLADQSGRLPSGQAREHHKLGNIILDGNVPAAGTTVRIQTWIPLSAGDEFEFTVTAADLADNTNAKNNLDKISVFPNPYLGANSLERDRYQRFMRFTDLPEKATVRIFTIAGIFVNKLEKDDATPYLDWNLRNIDGLPVASGVYIAYLDMPGIGTKIMKLAVIQEQQILDRIN